LYSNPIFTDWPGPLKICLVLMFEMWKLTSLDMWGRSCSQYAHCWLTPILTIHLYPKSLICTRLIGPNMKPQHGIGARSMPWVRHSAVGCNDIWARNYALSEVGVQIELHILRYSLGKMYGDGAVRKKHFVLRHSVFSHNGVLSLTGIMNIPPLVTLSRVCILSGYGC
jgi:hypothetical protein